MINIKQQIINKASFQAYQAKKGFPVMQKYNVTCNNCNKKFQIQITKWHYNKKKMYNIKQKNKKVTCPYCNDFNVFFNTLDERNKNYVDDNVKAVKMEDTIIEK